MASLFLCMKQKQQQQEQQQRIAKEALRKNYYAIV